MAEEGRTRRSSIFLSDSATPLPGTKKHPQGRLFAPIGNPAGDPWKHAPEHWMKQSDTPSHGDIISWHASHSPELARYDDPESRKMDFEDFEGPDYENELYDEEGNPNDDFEDFSVDSKDRPMAKFGSAIGMHFGDVGAAVERGEAREFLHPVRIPKETLTPPPRGNFSTPIRGGGISAGPHRSHNRVMNARTGESEEDTRWSDAAANYSEKATDRVEKGKTLAYRNDVEAVGSTSYRTLPETARTWSEDVLESKVAHPALTHLANLNYNPVQRVYDKGGLWDKQAVQPSLFDAADAAHSLETKVNQGRIESFHRGRMWSLKKPGDADQNPNNPEYLWNAD